ncbi:MAG: HD domain-containing protein [Lentisphaeria bacterium]|nr:HD domain-containing protein [Lentisphaeria bacterium]
MQAEKIIGVFYAKEPGLCRLLLRHSLQVRDKALQIAGVSGLALDLGTVSAGALLHDIGIIRCHAPGILCFGELPYISHGVAGAEMLRAYGPEHGLDCEACARICERHTGSGLAAEDIRAQHLPLPERDFIPERDEEILICLADKFFSKSGEMKEKSFASARRSMAKFGDSSLARFDAMCRRMNVSSALPPVPEISAEEVSASLAKCL